MTPDDRREFRDAITEAVAQFGWWAVLHECTQVLRETWHDSILKQDKQTAAAVGKAIPHCEDAMDALKEAKS